MLHIKQKLRSRLEAIDIWSAVALAFPLHESHARATVFRSRRPNTVDES
jgi:hypothetical protein